MRRWNGWGDDATTYPLTVSAARYLGDIVGPGQSIPDASFDQVVATVRSSRFEPQAAFSTDPADRVLHARGQSLPDWVAMRSGRIATYPDAVTWPTSDDDVRAWIEYGRASGIRLIPYGGGTSVAGHINPRDRDAPVMTLDLSRMNRLLELDETNLLATFEAGANGPHIEEQLHQQGYTLGHFPQSWELSTLGGWIATRSSGQQSYHYGRIENLLAGAHIETPAGPLDLAPLPASAAGPDLRQMVLGSEGRFGIITRATVRIRRRPAVDRFHAIFFRHWESGVEAVRSLAQAGTPVSMLRLSDPQETDATLNLSGKDFLIRLANRGLDAFGYGADRSLLIAGITGDPVTVRLAWRATKSVARRYGGLRTGRIIGDAWRKNRFRTPYLRNTLWEAGYAVDTLETALPWSGVVGAAAAIKAAIRSAAGSMNARVLVFAHLSHVYPDGASIYVTYLWPRSADPDQTLAEWRAMKHAASTAILEHHGTISHQHGVGADHAPYLAAEKGQTGIQMIEAVRQALDPERILNPGKLID